MIPRGTLLVVALAAQPLHAQAPGPRHAAAETITAADLQQRIGILAHDSMMGRDSPSPGLERAAGYVIKEFQRLGLRPAGEHGSYIQRFGLSRWTVDTATSSLELARGGTRIRVPFGASVRVVGGAVTGKPIAGTPVLLAGPLTPSITRDRGLRDRIVLIAPDFEQLPLGLDDRVDELAASAQAVILLSNRDPETFARRVDASLVPRQSPDFRASSGGAPVVELREDAIGAALGSDLDIRAVRAADSAAVRELPGLRVDLRLVRRYLERGTAPNLIGVLEGRDERLRHEYVAISAHLDHIGVRPGGADSIFNGADDNASGVAALLEIAEAFSRRDARPARSLLFLVPSAEEKGLWGSAYYVEHPTVPLRSVIADLNMDLIGRNWPDSVIVSGTEMSTLGVTLHRVASTHRDLRMAPLADRWPEERIFYRSDHYNFAVKGVPVLFFTSGTHTDYHRPSDALETIDVEKASRLARLVFHVGAAVANAPERPRWHPGTHRPLVEGQ